MLKEKEKQRLCDTKWVHLVEFEEIEVKNFKPKTHKFYNKILTKFVNLINEKIYIISLMSRIFFNIRYQILNNSSVILQIVYNLIFFFSLYKI